jgi:hypothetical protein
MALRYYHFKGPKLEKLFTKWDKILSWYETEWEDLPYWYLERTNVGHLALAVYDLSGIPLQEFTCKKGRGAESSAGRADLYISIPNGSRPIDLNIEAKQVWCSIANRTSQKLTLQQGLRKAVRDCKRLKEDAWKARYGVGVLFLLPYGKRMPDDISKIRTQRKLFAQFIAESSKDAGANFAAVHFPAIESLTKICRNVPDYAYCPGIAVIGKLVA